jgi:hypothetical protein
MRKRPLEPNEKLASMVAFLAREFGGDMDLFEWTMLIVRIMAFAENELANNEYGKRYREACDRWTSSITK